MSTENFFDKMNRAYLISPQPENTSGSYTPRQLKQYLKEQRSRAYQDPEQPLLKKGKGAVFEVLKGMTRWKPYQIRTTFTDEYGMLNTEKVAAFLANDQLLVSECMRKGINVNDLPLEQMIVLSNGSIDFQGIIYGPTLSD